MPLPILHSYAGYLVYKGFRHGKLIEHRGEGKAAQPVPRAEERDNLKWFIACIVLANLPDFDFIPGLIVGKANLFHRNFSHSIFAAVVVGALAADLTGLLRPCAHTTRRMLRNFWTGFAAYVSHCVLDLMNIASVGLMLLWPFSDKRFYSPFMHLGGQVDHSPIETAGGFADFLSVLLRRGYIQEALFEIAIICFIWAILTALGIRKNRASRAETPVPVTAAGLAAVTQRFRAFIHKHEHAAAIQIAIAFVFFAGGLMVGS